LHKQGRFWHIFFTEPSGALGGAIIAQDEIDTWTTHLFLPADAETDGIDTHEAIYRVLGGMYNRFPIIIDEILVRSVWRPSIAVTSTWHSPKYRVFLAGDAAHVNIPTGGYGMNMGIADAFDLGWKLSSVIKNEGGFGLFKSYEIERKPVALQNVQHSGVHFNVHMQLKELFGDENPKRVDDDTEEARLLRAKIQEYYQVHDGENKDFGVELGYRYQSPIVIPDDTSAEPVWEPSQYTPTTWPGGRPPHIFLSDGTAIFDKMGKGWTLLVFSDEDCGETLLLEAARSLNIPLLQVNLPKEKLAKTLYERNLLLIRPDQHVAWRADEVLTPTEAHRILNIVTGRSRIDTTENGILDCTDATVEILA
jgi:FAD-dependent monooxygenase